jgi:formate hydrogenlyase subunit 3/multisubunit Na+/H+ antiporter MnhD subunit
VASQLVRELPAERAYANTRARVIALLGPTTVVAGVVWAIVQPYRLTLLHPHHQGFWWLAIEPPLLVALAGIVFAVFVARPLVDDLEDDGTA